MPLLNIAASSTLIPGERAVAADATWEDLAYVVTAPAAIFPDVNRMIGRLSGETLGAGEIRVLEEANVVATFVVADAGAWTKQGLTVPGPLSDVPVRYTVQARLNGSLSFKLRGLSAALLVLPPVE